MSHNLKKLTTVALSVALLLGTTPVVRADEITDLQEQTRQLEEQRVTTEAKTAEMEQEKARLASEREALNKELEELDRRLTETQKELDGLNAQIEELLAVIEKTTQEINALRQDIEKNQKSFSDRLEAMYKMGNAGYLEVLLSSSNMNDFLSRSVMMQNIAEYDRTIIENLKTDKITLEQKEQELKGQQTALELVKESTEAKKLELEEMTNSKNALLSKIVEQEALTAAEIASLESRSSELSAEIAAKIERVKQLEEERRIAEEKRRAEEARLAEEEKQRAAAARTESRKPVYVTDGGSYAWPVPSSYNISSLYGTRIHPFTGAVHSHSGLDISAPTGADIIASKGGTVIQAGYNGAYGNCVQIDHGGGMVTVYGHCSALYVSSGQQVSSGQVVGAIGSTGQSTGPHLHFEVRINGVRVDPMNFL